jgi:hypothetical protein
MLEEETHALIFYLDSSLKNCEKVLFCNTPDDVANHELRAELSARQIAKLYGSTQKLLYKHVDQLGLGLSSEETQNEVLHVVNHTYYLLLVGQIMF